MSDKDSRIICVNKEEGWTSYDVVRVYKKKLNTKKIGHAGTLDPFATGLLILLVGSATKKFDEFQTYKKEYIATVVFGKETNTYDREGTVTYTYPDLFTLNKNTLEKGLENSLGRIQQLPPIYSALKINGKPAYRLARKGKEVTLNPRTVEVYKAEIISINENIATIRYVVSSGTYIRSLAHDLGKYLGCGAYLHALHRTQIGPYTLEGAEKIQK
jgi:tRNA pseudouridine55 synthase